MYIRVYFNHKDTFWHLIYCVKYILIEIFFNLKVLQRLYWFTTHLFLARKKQGDGKKKGKLTEAGNENGMDSESIL